MLFAPLDIVLTEYDVVQPDILLFTAERKHLLNAERVTRVPPDLAIEILSPSTVYQLTGGELALSHAATAGESVRSALLPELSLRPSELVFDLP
jgi:Uma2 family endonuclease